MKLLYLGIGPNSKLSDAKEPYSGVCQLLTSGLLPITLPRIISKGEPIENT